MKKILVISDTHSHIDNTILKYVKETDEVWHAGDVGNIELTKSAARARGRTRTRPSARARRMTMLGGPPNSVHLEETGGKGGNGDVQKGTGKNRANTKC